ncbi:hypothetical protein [Agrococcus sp. SGAir0287]|uniref:hypothetical protein n=1 Tax=Agrococcus sp. SGAir0287 TaxID=2070347 RepID=UPI0010CCD635|nr:hypothetical protein [Agrococcus sp. SGAir0287]QCR20098.1 hypothetical protein C1N71_12145 [Agrococcus sp. SGAir0287]
MTDLRRELGAVDPEWTMMLPAGWERIDADDRSLDELLERLKQRLMREHGVVAYAQTSERLRRAIADLQARGGTALMLPLEQVEGAQYIPASLSAAFIGASREELDATVAGLVADGAIAFGGDRRWVRAQSTQHGVEGEEAAALTTVRYLTPVPRTQRTRALVLTGSVLHDVGHEEGDPFLEGVLRVLDTHVATFRWLPRTAS